MKRSEFIHRVARTSILLFFGAGTGFLISKNKVSGRSRCSENFLCKGCRKLSSCKLPEAQKHQGSEKG